MERETRDRIDGHWSRRFGVPVPGLAPVLVAATGRYDDAALVVLLGDHAYVDAPIERAQDVAALVLPQSPAAVLDPYTWTPLASAPALGPADHFWADHGTDLSVDAPTIDPADLELLRPAVSDAEWREAGFDREPHACFGIVEGGELVAASVLTALWGWPVDVGVLVAPQARGRGLGVTVAAAALAAGVGLSGFAAFRAARANAASRAVAARLGLDAYGANVVVPLPPRAH